MRESHSIAKPDRRSRIAGIVLIVVFAVSMTCWLTVCGSGAVEIVRGVLRSTGFILPEDRPRTLFGIMVRPEDRPIVRAREFCMATMPVGVLLAPTAFIAARLLGPRWPLWLRIALTIPPLLALFLGPALFIVGAIRR